MSQHEQKAKAVGIDEHGCLAKDADNAAHQRHIRRSSLVPLARLGGMRSKGFSLRRSCLAKRD